MLLREERSDMKRLKLSPTSSTNQVSIANIFIFHCSKAKIAGYFVIDNIFSYKIFDMSSEYQEFLFKYVLRASQRREIYCRHQVYARSPECERNTEQESGKVSQS